ncbi:MULTISPECIES: hypothetical protein [unclassified Sphingobium]|uniref:hypothetical protein n=1 Tax=unclassified Sphingobium TaxID=2611147 RepID=UPI0035A6BB56
MKAKYLIAATCVLPLVFAAPASAQLLGGGGGGGLGGALGGSLGGAAGGLGGTLNNGVGGRGALDRSVDLDNGTVSTRTHGHGRAHSGSRVDGPDKSRRAAGSANGSGSLGASVDTIGVNDVRSATGAVRDRATDTAGAARDRAAMTAGVVRDRATGTAGAVRDRAASTAGSATAAASDATSSANVSGSVTGNASASGNSNPGQADE